MDEKESVDREELREEIVKDWLRVTQRDMDLEEVLDYIESYDLNAELLDVSPYDEPISELEALAFHIKSRERGLLDGRMELLTTVATARPFLDALFKDIERYGETERYRNCIDSLNELDIEDLDLLVEATNDYWGTREYLTVAQNHVTLTNDLLQRDKPFRIDGLSDARQGIDIYKKCMDICDSGFPALLNMKYVAEDKDPRDKDFISMGFGAARQLLEDHDSFSPLVDAVDADLRNAISHGDIGLTTLRTLLRRTIRISHIHSANSTMLSRLPFLLHGSSRRYPR